jgi:hypothetical protein
MAVLLFGTTGTSQERTAEPAFVAFRVDEHRVIATLTVTEPLARQVREGLSPEPVARFGYRHFEPPASWHDRVPADIRDARRWTIHAGPGQVFAAETERLVGGNAQCTEAVAVLLRIDAPRAEAFAALPARYFIAGPARPEAPAAATASAVRSLPSPVFTVPQRQAFESTLNQLLARELPRVRAEAAPGLRRMAASTVGHQRSWARQRQLMEDELASGRGRLTYDIQSFLLAPDGVPIHFVRAEWSVQRRQAFAASLWMRGAQPTEIIQTDLRPASWLRMFLFQGKVATEQLGLVLNVLDRDGDGWGEVLMSQSGYEGLRIQLFEYSPGGFQPAGTEFACGC